MLRNANPKSFSAIYIVCGYTDMRYGIDKLASIVDLRYHISVFEPDTLFLFLPMQKRSSTFGFTNLIRAFTTKIRLIFFLPVVQPTMVFNTVLIRNNF